MMLSGHVGLLMLLFQQGLSRSFYLFLSNRLRKQTDRKLKGQLSQRIKPNNGLQNSWGQIVRLNVEVSN